MNNYKNRSIFSKFEEGRIIRGVSPRGSREIEFDVRGAEPMLFCHGGRTGNMESEGVHVETVWYGKNTLNQDDDRRFGGCMDREQVIAQRDFLNESIEVWENENLISVDKEID